MSRAGFRSEVLVGRTPYTYEVETGGILTVWVTAAGSERIVGRGLVVGDGGRKRITQASQALTDPLKFAIEQQLNREE
jgi:hypothetical protein